jgi:ATP-dependent protease ClpP protease subunit
MSFLIRLIALAIIAVTCPAYADNQAKPTSDTIVLTRQNSVGMRYEFSEDTVPQLIDTLTTMDRPENGSDPIYLVLYTPGGSIQSGINLFEAIKKMRRKVITITVFAASMGFHTVQNLGDRYILKHGTLMTHKPRGYFGGEFGGDTPSQLDARYRHYLTRIDEMDKHVVSRTNGKQTLKSYRALMENEYWCDGQECVDKGFADGIVTAKCDENISKGGLVDRVVLASAQVNLMVKLELVQEFSMCPLNVEPLSTEIYANGRSTKEIHLWDSKSEIDQSNPVVINMLRKQSNILRNIELRSQEQ